MQDIVDTVRPSDVKSEKDGCDQSVKSITLASRPMESLERNFMIMGGPQACMRCRVQNYEVS